MTTYYASPTGHHDANPHHDDPTVRRPEITFTRPAGPPVPSSTPPSKSGWIVSGLAAVLAAAALGVVGSHAIAEFTDSDLAAGATSASPSPAPNPGVASAAPAAVLPAPVPAPVVTVTPGVSDRGQIVGAPRIVVTVPAAPSAVPSSPVATPPTPMEPPAPVPVPPPSSGGIGTCDLVACDPVPPTSGGIPSCGDFRACGPIQPAQPGRPRV